ncbi:hypothetical protein BE04_38665 [Sorangium cellulosum]|uniref:Uncharacterized protein n=3 Tax=Polyangiaceae TaxID=49 RepID=A0A150PPD1_SORCE|nr:hypothetical protein SCE1572_05725 [Sorangium cellulosum So0157-2]KYF57406.1 hypothetical protein BE04_38665 [Sorangium cellulosum]KYG07326.1 hypothetical protein BE21_29945 [Sorangium cellulosum]
MLITAMSIPQKPVASAQLLATAAPLSFRATSRDRSGSTLGVLLDASGAQQHLVIEEGGQEGTWMLSSALPYGHASFLLYESAANVLRGGNLSEGGTISYQGALYTIETSLDGNTRTAKVSGSV